MVFILCNALWRLTVFFLFVFFVCFFFQVLFCLTLTMLWADSADDKLVIFVLLFLENRIRHFMQIVS